MNSLTGSFVYFDPASLHTHLTYVQWRNAVGNGKRVAMTNEFASPSNPIVAIVADDESMRGAAKSVLNASGFATEAFQSADAFLKSDVKNSAVCLVTDVQMPRLNGREQHDDQVRSGEILPTVFIAACTNDKARSQASNAGTICCLDHQFNHIEFLERVRAGIELGKSQSVKTTTGDDAGFNERRTRRAIHKRQLLRGSGFARLTAFAAVAHHGSFSRAAKYLGQSITSLSFIEVLT